MQYSQLAHNSGASGFFFDGDKNAPSDAFPVLNSDVQIAVNLPPGSTYSFSAPANLNSYGTLNITSPSYATLLVQAKTAQLLLLSTSYTATIQAPVSFKTSGGVTNTYQADSGSVNNLQNTLLGFQKSGITPTGFYWVAVDNTQVPFTYADLQGLAAAMITQGWTAFQHLQTQKAAVNAATTVTQVQSIVW